jgi:hypothetical protein
VFEQLIYSLAQHGSKIKHKRKLIITGIVTFTTFRVLIHCQLIFVHENKYRAC